MAACGQSSKQVFELEQLQEHWDVLVCALRDVRAEACKHIDEPQVELPKAEGAQQTVQTPQNAGCKLQAAYESLQMKLHEAIFAEGSPNVRHAFRRPEAGESRLETWMQLRAAARQEEAEACRAEAAKWRHLAERRGDELHRLRQELLVHQVPSSTDQQTPELTSEAAVKPRTIQLPQPDEASVIEAKPALNVASYIPTPARAGLNKARSRRLWTQAGISWASNTQYFDIGSPYTREWQDSSASTVQHGLQERPSSIQHQGSAKVAT
eukprot:TRINITY_DN52501_c0_g1_i1.p1 TRINITY_DN52501_c0_g1~~TRINITY_DN52501_c0_g1_i1.p1  ORF type:complete len:267 (-),score=56.32 TRINITY_DN52501_c0_g1_i1:134-934(-)